jgi:hypothetical protein
MITLGMLFSLGLLDVLVVQCVGIVLMSIEGGETVFLCWILDRKTSHLGNPVFEPNAQPVLNKMSSYLRLVGLPLLYSLSEIPTQDLNICQVGLITRD